MQTLLQEDSSGVPDTDEPQQDDDPDDPPAADTNLHSRSGRSRNAQPLTAAKVQKLRNYGTWTALRL